MKLNLGPSGICMKLMCDGDDWTWYSYQSRKREAACLGPWRGAVQMAVLKPCLSSFD